MMPDHEGRLAEVAGMGRRRVAAIRAALAEIVDRSRLRHRRAVSAASEPSVEVLLDVDREYRDKARAGASPTIAPRRFNPEHKPWLPVLHTKRDDWHFTVLFSNTGVAHDLHRTRDWVVLYFHDDEPGGTATHGGHGTTWPSCWTARRARPRNRMPDRP